MNSLDEVFQCAVDDLANQLLKWPAAELLSRPKFGSIEIAIQSRKVKVGFWSYEMSGGQHHIVFKTSRRVFFFLHKTYISGVVFDENSPVRKMNYEELGQHD
jgi:hypothetical protein